MDDNSLTAGTETLTADSVVETFTHSHVPDEHHAPESPPAPIIYPPENEALIDVLFLARNRLEFTVESLRILRKTTDWSMVNKLWLYDDQSEDGTADYLDRAFSDFSKMDIKVSIRHGRFNSPLAVLVDCVKNNPCGRIAKVDNDTIMPPGWLNVASHVLDHNPELDLLGLGYRDESLPDPGQSAFTYTPAPFVGGIGLFRIRVLRPIPVWDYEDRQWNGINQSAMKVGWLTPNLPVVLLDKVRFAPWCTYADRYKALGYHRDWRKYSPDTTFYRWWSDNYRTEHIHNPYPLPD